MKWIKLGRVFTSEKQHSWMESHASVPIAEHIEGNLFRIYFTPRDAKKRSHVGYLVIDISRPREILELAAAPVLEPGSVGAFDDSGAMSSCLIRHDGRRLLYYTGWTLGGTVPWHTAIGVVSCSASSPPIFERHVAGPIIDKSVHDPFFVSSPFVLVEGALWRMWYISGIGWVESPKGPLPRYHMRYAESPDGVRWTPTGRVCIDHEHPGEVAIGRPCVIKDPDRFRMWFSHRGDDYGYRIGYAESLDGLIWQRLDHKAGFGPSDGGWDSEMTAYPAVFDHRGERYMLYCGNDYSRAGFGLAILQR